MKIRKQKKKQKKKQTKIVFFFLNPVLLCPIYFGVHCLFPVLPLPAPNNASFFSVYFCFIFV